MALTATPYRFHIALSDVDRGVYEALDLRPALHPSETLRFLLTRVLAYALSYEEGIAFSKGGLSSTDEPPVAVHDPTGRLLAWIDVGSPSADRLHKAAKAADRVAVFTTVDLALQRKEAAAGAVHRAADIEVWRVDADLLAALEPHVERTTRLEVLRTGGQLYLTVDGQTFEGALDRSALADDAAG